MKRLLLTIITAMSCIAGHGEHDYTLHNTLNSGQNYHYTANSHILLNPGFKSEPTGGHEVILDIDSYDISPSLSGLTGGPFPSDNGVVGTLGGTVDVGLLGGAIYNIPINLPEGLGGITPQLSISYNSQSQNGLLGWGWDLIGISAITRTGGTLYHDGYVSAINYVKDRFCLDGNRLMKVGSGTYGANNVSYRTEQDQLNKIVSYRETGTQGPSYFKVWTADGKIMHYGSSTDSKALKTTTQHINVWLLKKVEDRYGNQMEYFYQNESDTYRLSRITYSSNENDNISPSFSVELNYNDREDIEVAYIGNSIYRKKHILNSISIKNGNSEMYSYRFIYQEPQPQNGYPYHLLTEIRLFAGDTHINPTRIQWGDNNYSATSSSNLKVNVSTNNIDNAFVHAVKFSGDFNGDGFTDVVAVRQNDKNQYERADVFINKGVSGNLTFDFARSFSLNSDISWIQIADLNGDGLDDLIFTRRNRGFIVLPDRIYTDIYLCEKTASALNFSHYDLPDYLIPKSMVEAHLTGDFFGEGKSSILIQAATSDPFFADHSFLISYSESEDCFVRQRFNQILNADRFFPADYNGDGITEILYKKGNGETCIAQLAQSNETYTFNETSYANPNFWDDCFPGDFNGDGMTDALFYTANNSSPWTIWLSKSTGIGSVHYNLPQSFPYQSLGNYMFSLDQPNHTYQYLKIGDFDGNGCSDIALYKDNFFYVFYGPIRTYDNSTAFAGSHKISNNNFGYYDNMDVCLGNFFGQDRMAFLGSHTCSHLPSLIQRHEVKRVINGFGRKTEFAFDYLMPNPNNPTEDDFFHLYHTPNSYNQNVLNVSLPIRGLKKLTTYNVNDKAIETRCFYEGAKLHKQGKRFLGFSKTRQDDYCNNQLQKKTIRQFDHEVFTNIVKQVMIEECVFDKNAQLMAKSSYSNMIFTHQLNEKVYIHLANKSTEEYDIDNPSRMVKKEIHETSVSTHCSSSSSYNSILSVVSQIKGITDQPNIVSAHSCEFQETINTTYTPDDISSWLINKPETTTNIVHREGNYDDIYHHKRFYYDDNKPYQINTIIELPNDGSYPLDKLALKTEYLYDATGNIISQTLSTPNDNPFPRTESFEYGQTYGRRLLTKRTNAIGQNETFQYDPVYNYCSSHTDFNGLVTCHEQDPFGITCKTIHPDGTVSYEATRWSSNGFSKWEKQTGKAAKTTIYSLSGDILKNHSYDLNGELLITEVKYDNLGRIQKKSAPTWIGETPQYVSFNYDTHNRINKITYADGTYETIQHNGNQETATASAHDGSHQSTSKTVNVMGWIISSTDADGNNVIYDYYPDGKPKWFQIEGQNETKIEMTYDALGNRISLNDPNYGLMTCEYNAFGELTKQTTPKTDETYYYYNNLGQISKRIETNTKNNMSVTTEWKYTQDILTKIISPNQTFDYEYDNLFRLEKTTEKTLGKDYITRYSYDDASRISSIIYPSNYSVNYCYNSEGHLRSIMDDNDKILWKMCTTNNLMQPTKFVTGNGFITNYEYDDKTNRLTAIRTTLNEKIIQNYQYQYDDYSNLTNRSDLKHAFSETFTYDNLNRLTSATDLSGTSCFGYDPLGRMISKTDHDITLFSNADYSGPKPHAIKAVNSMQGVFPQERMELVFNSFDKISSITEGLNQVSFEYGVDHQRIKSEENIDGKIRNKFYVGNCEFIEEQGQIPVVRTFLSCPSGVFAVAETKNGNTRLHYVHKDHLGSWTTISNSNGIIEQETSFDAWGNCKKAGRLMFDRGYTGHEHINGMGLINMNGRLYDPVTSSMLSPDNNIQLPDFSQNLNRYSYCINNPLTYTDPDGNSFMGSAIMFYLLYCTDYGYEAQKHISPIAYHLDLHLSSQQMGIGFDVSVGMPKSNPYSLRFHTGATYYWHFYDNSYQGTEFRTGMEHCAGGLLGLSGTSFYHGREKDQTTNAIIIGDYSWNIIYENDYMFNLGNHLLFGFAADNGDRYRSAAAKIRIGPHFHTGVNLFTGNPGVDHEVRCIEYDPNVESRYYDYEAGGRATYTTGANGENPNEFRAGVFYVGFGPFRIGGNSEQIRNTFQNKFAHDFLCKGDSPYFRVLDRPAQTYFYFGSGTGNTLW